jgi:hypothetical protein
MVPEVTYIGHYCLRSGGMDARIKAMQIRYTIPIEAFNQEL